MNALSVSVAPRQFLQQILFIEKLTSQGLCGFKMFLGVNSKSNAHPSPGLSISPRQQILIEK
jgi:hypothetical protein